MRKTYVLVGEITEWEAAHEPCPVEGADRHFDLLEIRIRGVYSTIMLKCRPEQTEGAPLFPSILRALAERPASMKMRCSIELDEGRGADKVRPLPEPDPGQPIRIHG